MPRIVERAGHPSGSTDGASTGPRHRCRGSRSRERCARHGRGRFNGASASMPRIGTIAKWRSPGGTVLQRGLGIDAEDRSVSVACTLVLVAASTGPRHRCRGSTRPAVTAHVSPMSFNGASASMPRIATEMGTKRGEADASTGPRHRCRGSLNMSSTRHPRTTMLQRGLGIDAEDRC